MPVTVAQQWQNSFSPALFSGALASTAIQPPAAQSLPVTTTHTSGNWMLAICAWVQAVPGQGVSVSVDDDANNRWEPLGPPNADSAAAGPVRISIWYAPAARVGNIANQATTVMVAPTGAVLALGAIVLDISGMQPWDQLAFVPVSAFALAASSLSLTSGTPAASSFAVTACAADANSSLSLSSGSGWTALTGTSVSAAGSASLFALAGLWKTTAAANSVTWSVASGTPDLAAIMGAVVVAAAAPAAPDPNWPVVITEAAPGAGPGTPAAQLNWQAISARSLSFSVQQGQPYLLGGLQAATGALVLDNPDLAVSPPGNGVWAGLDAGTPVRVRAIWPASSTPHYVRFSGFLQQAPTDFDEQLRGRVQATLTDAYAYANSYLKPCLQAELLSEPSLYALWPCNDPAGSTAASNLAPGNQNPLLVTASKYGFGSTIEAFGQNSGALKGDSGSGMWGQSGVTAGLNHGNSLHAPDGNYPAISGGVTVEGWFQFTSGTPSNGVLLALTNGLNTVLQITVGTVSTNLSVTGYQSPSKSTQVNISALNFVTAPLFHVAVSFTQTSYAIYVNGGTTALVTGTWTFALPPAFTHLWCNGFWASGGAATVGGLYNGYTSYVAVCGAALPAVRIAAHYQAGALAFAGEFAHQRAERILSYARLTGRRCVVPEAPGMPGGFTSPGGDQTPMASMSTLGGTIPSLYAPGVPGFAPASGTQASSALAATVASLTPAVFDVAPGGAFFFYPRSYATRQGVPRWVLGDSTAAGEIPVLGDLSFPYDPGRVVNDVQLTQPDTGSVTVPAISEAGSVQQYGDQPYQVTAHLQVDASAGYTPSPAMTDLANWVADINYSPRMRAAGTVKSSHISPSVAALAWPFVLGAAPGDVVTVNARPPTSPGAVVSVTGRIVQVTPKLVIDGAGSTEGSLQFTLDIAPEVNTLTCDNVSLGTGLLNGVNCLGW